MLFGFEMGKNDLVVTLTLMKYINLFYFLFLNRVLLSDCMLVHIVSDRNMHSYILLNFCLVQ